MRTQQSFVGYNGNWSRTVMVPEVKLIIDIGMNIGYRDSISRASFYMASPAPPPQPRAPVSRVWRAAPNPIRSR